MNHVLLAAIGFLFLISAVMFAAGFFVGRLGERSAIADWLFDIPDGLRADASTWGDAIGKGAHRLAEKLDP